LEPDAAAKFPVRLEMMRNGIGRRRRAHRAVFPFGFSARRHRSTDRRRITARAFPKVKRATRPYNNSVFLVRNALRGRR
jgi:hypothetical protein